MVWPGFVIFVPYANQRFADVRRMLFDRRDSLRFFGLLFTHMPLFSKKKSCVKIKSRHILRLIINTVNYQIKTAYCFGIQTNALPTPAWATQLSTNKGNSRAPG